MKLKARIIGDIHIIEPKEKAIDLPMGETVMFKAEVLNDRGVVMPDAKFRWRMSSYAAAANDPGVAAGASDRSFQLLW